jgi:hypothetical protein
LPLPFLLAVIGHVGEYPFAQPEMPAMTELVGQLINLLASILLMLAFAMISQRRILSLIHLFTAQGAALVAATVRRGLRHAAAASVPVGRHYPAA